MGKLEVHELKLGMVIAEPIYSTDHNQLLLKIGTRLTEKLIQNLIQSGIKYVEVADRYTLLVNPKERMLSLLDQQMLTEISKIAPDSIEANKTDYMVEVAKRVKKIAHEIVQIDEVLELCLQMLTVDKSNMFSHGIHTSVLSMLVAGAMDLTDNEIRDIGIAALLQNLGVCEMPFLIGKKEFTPQEELLWKEHSTYGYYFAMQNNISHDIASLILCHHEHFDGSGYPKQKKGDSIPLGARIINVCCEYDELVTVKGHQPYEAIEYMYCSSDIYYDKNVIKTFTDNISVYPLGSLVRLTTKEIGIVVNIRKNQGPRPLVMVYYNRVNKPLSKPKLIDLGKEKTIFIEEVIHIN